MTMGSTTGAVVSSSTSPSTTVKLAVCASDVLPAASVARNWSVCAPTASTTNGSV
ncbi:Uncharacterised protein [Mycobacteroides abscessus]|nr:Uncharacterised protein [Mycobacteroides abscessus]